MELYKLSSITIIGTAASILLSNLPFETVGKAMEMDQLCDAVNLILSLQNRNGGFASYELTRSYTWLEVQQFLSLIKRGIKIF
ncbi:cycloartenol synthase [Trifolium repens]|nr:cycloartenol synthase [Trifolium repens]